MRAGPKKGLGNRIAPARFVGFIVLFLAALAGLRVTGGSAGWQDATAMAFDIAAAAFLISLAPLLRHASAATMRAHARENDTNRVLVLIVTSVLTVVVMAAIGGGLKGAQSGDGVAIAKLVVTLALIWLFANSVYALHYAHHYYQAPDARGAESGDRRGMEFPGTKTPGYVDFAYFAFTLGMTFQTSDVTISDTRLRAIVILHSAAAFVFNIGIIAFTINALGGG